ncbi:MAG: hypothetical protein Q7R30_04065 [Acidobacteriota bacterium]|nr:hypothetical protein [Acidobacteriota bacterium]
MTRRGFVLAALLLLGVVRLSAHEKFRIVGTVVKVQATQLDVKAADGQTYEIDMDAKTRVTRNKKTVVRSELKAGRSVVVDALGHDMFDLVAVEIQLAK